MASSAEISAERARMLSRFRSMTGGVLISETIEAKEFEALTADDWHYCLRTLDVTRDVVANLTIELRRSEEYCALLRRQLSERDAEVYALRQANVALSAGKEVLAT